MKKVFWRLTCCATISFAPLAFSAPGPAPVGGSASKGATNVAQYNQKTDRGPHHRILYTGQLVTNRIGGVMSVTAKTNQIVELATGLHYLTNNQWLETQEFIEIEGNKGVAKRGPHRVTFSSNPKDAGAIDLTAGDGKRFRSHVLGVSYYDAASGKSVMLAEVQNSQGQVVPPNQVIYTNAFDSINADIRYTYKRSGLSQDVILREDLPGPEDYGLNPESTRLEVITEFLDPPVPQKKQKVLRKEKDSNRRAAMVEPDFTDETLSFGAMRMVPGKAFNLQEAKPAPQKPATSSNAQPPPVIEKEKAVPVGKRWTKLEGRDFLIEAVEYASVKEQLKSLPMHKADAKGGKKQASNQRELPDRRVAQNDSDNEMHLAGSIIQRQGLVLDYSQVSSGGDEEGFTFSSGQTYYLSDYVHFGGEVILFDAVLKYAPGASLHAGGNFSCEGSGAILTAVTDNTVGETIVTGLPSGYYASPAVELGGEQAYGVSFEVRYAYTGISFSNSTDSEGNPFNNSSSAIIRNCHTGVVNSWSSVSLSGLICNVVTPYELQGSGSFSVSYSTDCSQLPSIPPPEDGNSMGTATPASPGATISGAIGIGGDVDYFRVEINDFGFLSAYTTGQTDTYGLLLDSGGNVLAEDDDSPYPNFRLSRAVSPGTYYIAVRHYNAVSGTGSYLFQVDFAYGINEIPEGSFTEIPKSSMTADASSTYAPWPPQNAIDGSWYDPGWHNCCSGTTGEWLRVNLGTSYPVSRVQYRPRSPIHNGAFVQYQIFVTDSSSTSPSLWGAAVASGSWSWAYGAQTRTINFAPKQGKYVIFQCMYGIGGYASADEVWIYYSPPATPTGLLAVGGYQQIGLSWNPVGGATSYNVKRSGSSGGPYNTIATGLSPTYLNSGLAPATTHYYKISAVGGGGESGDSSVASATTLSGGADSDGDGLPDPWELQYFGNLNQNGLGDWDGDGINNLQEFQKGTDPVKDIGLQVFTLLK
jgi:hypothetical protein